MISRVVVLLLAALAAFLGLSGCSNPFEPIFEVSQDGDSDYMDCGSVKVCGILVLETGLGRGEYDHKDPSVHGLWPQTGNYGSSKCVAPQDDSDPTQVFACYAKSSKTQDDALDFESHEWEHHGTCAGVHDASDFFKQVCGLSADPVEALLKAKRDDSNVQDLADALRNQGYPVWSTNEHEGQIQLAACADGEGQWKLAATSDFGAKCGGSAQVVLQ